MIDDIIKRNFSFISDQYKKFCCVKNECKGTSYGNLLYCEIYQSYQTVVHSEGNAKNPTFMICGEAPGKVECEEHRPFIGPAGQLLREHLRNFSFNKKNTILTNVLPCRPLNNQFPKEWDVVSKCFTKWLLKEIEILKPKIIITCGAPALKAVTNKTGVTNNRGKWMFSDNRQAYVFPTWHPSYVLRCQNDPQKQNVPIEFKNDLKRVAAEWQFIVYSNKKMNMNKTEYEKEVKKEYIANYEEQMDTHLKDFSVATNAAINSSAKAYWDQIGETLTTSNNNISDNYKGQLGNAYLGSLLKNTVGEYKTGPGS